MHERYICKNDKRKFNGTELIQALFDPHHISGKVIDDLLVKRSRSYKFWLQG
jgi:hypothetical protein